MQLGVYDNAFKDRTSTKSIFDFRKQASRKDMIKHESVSSIDYISTKALVKEKLAPKITSSVIFNKQKERDEILYKHKNQMAENIALENNKEEREKIVIERKKNRYKYRSELQTKLSMCAREERDNKKYEIAW